MRYEFRPLENWPDRTAHGEASPFRAGWSDTLTLLDRETEHLGAKLVVIQVDALEAQIRRDGMLRSGAKVGYRGVKISLESKHGPLTYAADKYDAPSWRNAMASWQHNIRAIALGLESLRAVDRYGITRSGEQYRGWAAIEARAVAARFSTKDEACAFIGAAAGWTTPPDWMDPYVVKLAFRQAAKRLHPDAGGDPDQWHRLDEAARLLGIKS